MAINVGTYPLKNCFLGNRQIYKIYAGSELLWQLPIPEDYLLRWDFNGTLEDGSTNNLDGSTANVPGEYGAASPTFSTGMGGAQCLQFTPNQAISTPQTGLFAKHTKVFSFWIKTTQTAHANIICTRTHVLYEAGILISKNAAGQIQVSSTNQNIKTSSITINDGLWHHVLVRATQYETANDCIAIFVDGANVTQNTATNSATSNAAASYITLGFGRENGGWFDGQIQRLRFYGRQLTQWERWALQNEQF